MTKDQGWIALSILAFILANQYKIDEEKDGLFLSIIFLIAGLVWSIVGIMFMVEGVF